jgi:hypothetical protein
MIYMGTLPQTCVKSAQLNLQVLANVPVSSLAYRPVTGN